MQTPHLIETEQSEPTLWDLADAVKAHRESQSYLDALRGMAATLAGKDVDLSPYTQVVADVEAETDQLRLKMESVMRAFNAAQAGGR